MLVAGVFFAYQEREEQSSKLAQALGVVPVNVKRRKQGHMPSKNSTAVRRKKKRVESCGNLGFFWGGKKWEDENSLPTLSTGNFDAPQNDEALMRLRSCRSRWWHCNVRLMN